jgi:hypothetical protein
MSNRTQNTHLPEVRLGPVADFRPALQQLDRAGVEHGVLDRRVLLSIFIEYGGGQPTNKQHSGVGEVGEVVRESDAFTTRT